MKGIIFIGLFFLVTACTVVSEEGSEVKPNSEVGAFLLIDLLADSLAKVSEQAFERLLSKSVQERLIGPEDTESRDLLHRFFPNTSRFVDYHVSIQPIALRDSFWLILYEFITDGQDKSQMFLGSFHKTGQIIDLLEMHPISFDGHISLSLLEEDVMEIEYRDFKIKSDFSNAQDDKELEPSSALTNESAPFQYFIKEGDQSENSGTKYYRVHSNGSFEALAKAGNQNMTRIFPQVSSNVLTVEELERLYPDELQLMRNELYASYGFIFKEETLKWYFKQQEWYKPDSNFTLDRLSDIERVNLEKILEMEEMPYYNSPHE